MKRHRIAIAALLALGAAQSTAWAQDGNGPTVKVGGFGTGALTWLDTNDAQFVTPGQGYGAGKTPRTGPDSNLGLQVDAQINDWLSLTGQGLVRKFAGDYYGAQATLAFARARLSDDFSVRVGRLPMAIFMMSDYRHVGYSNIMLRPANEVYSQVPMDTVDGADLTWNRSFGDTTVTSQLSYGRNASLAADHARISEWRDCLDFDAERYAAIFEEATRGAAKPEDIREFLNRHSRLYTAEQAVEAGIVHAARQARLPPAGVTSHWWN